MIFVKTSRMPLFVAATRVPVQKYKLNVRRNSKNLVALSLNSSFGERMTYCLSTVSRCLLRCFDFYSKYHVVPVKYEHVVFCGLSEFQLALYRLFISSPEIKALLRGTDSQPLKAINILKKLCNHPELLNLPSDLHGSEKLLPEGYGGAGATARDKGKNQTVRCDWGGKFLVLERFLHRLKTTTNDKIVLISNYTQTLDLFEKLCRSKK